MEWLGVATNNDLATQFYQAMFVKGLGQQDAASFISALEIAFPKSISNDVKFEVSKGLAMESTTLMRPKDCQPIEVIGEEGFTIENKLGQVLSLDADNSITADMMSCLGDKFYGSSSAGHDSGFPRTVLADYPAIFRSAHEPEPSTGCPPEHGTAQFHQGASRVSACKTG